jgi:hypothetical protein
MLAPIDKISCGGNDIVQIVVTRKCDLFNCSNCTQLLPFRTDAIEMSPDCFREALRSMAGWPGIVAMFGGNPCTHSQFPLLCKIMAEEIPAQHRRGLWTNCLRGHGAIARDTFWPHGRFNCNAHADEDAAAEIEQWLPGKLIQKSRSSASWHSPVMIDRRDVGVGDAEWIAMRENCDINQKWSAAIRQGPDGRPVAYFCEVAAALDGVRGENHGIPAVPDWWKLGMDDFAHQVAGCCDRGCGVPLRLRGHLDRDDTYDVSPSFAPLTVRGKSVRIVEHKAMPAEHVQEMTDYQRLRTPV